MRDTFSDLLHVVGSRSRDSFSLVYRPAYRPHAAKVGCIFGAVVSSGPLGGVFWSFLWSGHIR